MKILPHIQKSLTILLPSGHYIDVPFQIFMADGGDTIIRLGNTTLWFDKDGHYDGAEYLLTDEKNADAFEAAHEASDRTRGMAPDEPYFQPGTSGWKREVAGWANARVDLAPKRSAYRVSHDHKDRKAD